MQTFQEILVQGAIPIGQTDQSGISLRQFDEIQYRGDTYLIIWHPLYHQFVGSHESGEWISSAELAHTTFIRNLKEEYAQSPLTNSGLPK